MKIEVVSDVFAFCASRPDFWGLLLPDPVGNTVELQGDDLLAFDAARDHVQKSYIELLFECLSAFQRKIAEDEKDRYASIVNRRPQTENIRENQFIEIHLVRERGREVWLTFELGPDTDDLDAKRIQLWAKLGPRIGNIHHLRTFAVPKPPEIVEDGHNLLFGNYPLQEGDRFTDLADRLATLGWPAVERAVAWGLGR